MCNFPYTGQYCNITFKDYLDDIDNGSYLSYQLFYCIFGGLTFAFTFGGLISFETLTLPSYKAKLLKSIIYLTMLNSLTLLVRGMDPRSYADDVPFSVNQLMWNMSSSTIYTLLFVILFYWLRVMNDYQFNNTFVLRKLIALNIISWVSAFLFTILQAVYVDDGEYKYRAAKLYANVFIIGGLIYYMDIILKEIVPFACMHLYNRTNPWREFFCNKALLKLKIIVYSVHIIGITTMLYNIVSASIMLDTKISSNVSLPTNGMSFSFFLLFQSLSIFMSLFIIYYPRQYTRV